MTTYLLRLSSLLALLISSINIHLLAIEMDDSCSYGITVDTIDSVILDINMVEKELDGTIGTSGSDTQTIGTIQWTATHDLTGIIGLSITQIQNPPVNVPSGKWWIGKKTPSGYSNTDFLVMELYSNVDPTSTNTYNYVDPSEAIDRTGRTNSATLTADTPLFYEDLVGELTFIVIDNEFNTLNAGIYTGKFIFKLD